MAEAFLKVDVGTFGVFIGVSCFMTYMFVTPFGFFHTTKDFN